MWPNAGDLPSSDQTAGRIVCPSGNFSEELYSDAEAPVRQPLAINHAGKGPQFSSK